MSLYQIVERVLNRVQRQPRGAEEQRIIEAYRETYEKNVDPNRRLSQCRTCGKPAQVQLIQEPDLDEFTMDDVLDIKYEFLCYEDLGIFLEIFADPRQKEWTVVRL